MPSMATQKQGKLNQLERLLPEGLLADAAWMTRKGYSTALRSQYVNSGWLEQPTRGVYRRARGGLSWEQSVVSLQTNGLSGAMLVVGGKTALELQGYAHYLPQAAKEVHLYGHKPPPRWLMKLPLDVAFLYHNDGKLFRSPPPPEALVTQPWGQWDSPMTLASPELAVLQLLDELPARESFDQVDKLFEGLANLSPRRLQKLLAVCRSVKVKRLFFFFADRHAHGWLKHLDKRAVDFGAGKRALVKGGKFDAAYQITLPKELFDGLR